VTSGDARLTEFKENLERMQAELAFSLSLVRAALASNSAHERLELLTQATNSLDQMLKHSVH